MEVEARHVAQSPWLERLACFGLVAQGVSFGLVAVLAIGFGAYALWRLAPVFAIAVGRTSRTARCSWHSSPQDCSATGVFCLIQARYREV